MDMKKLLNPFTLAAIILSSAFPAFAANITCQLNPATGKIEASQAWKNVLGDEADRACEKAMPSVKNNVAPILPAHVATSQLTLMQQPVRNNPQFGVATSQSVMPVNPVAIVTPLMSPQIQQNIVKKATMIAETAWRVELKDITLSTTFARWADTAGWKMRWDADKNILIDAPDSFTGIFEDAVASVLSSDGIQQGVYPLEVCFYTNTPPLARITRKGEQKDCK